MKKKIIICTITILIMCLLFISLKKESQYIETENFILSLSLDGKGITSFPSGKNYRVEVSCEGAIGVWDPVDWKLLVEEIDGDTICNIDFYTRSNNDLLANIVQNNAYYTKRNNDEIDAGYRYSGEEVNNYINFNNESWRIIGYVPVKNESGNITNLVKIIRNQSIGTLAYDAKSSGFTNVWGNNTLYTLLNSYYYGREDGTETEYCYTNYGYYDYKAKGKCNYTNIGISSDQSDYYGNMIEKVYWNTGASSSSVTPGESYKEEITNQSVSAYIGIISASDFGYAISEKYHDTAMKTADGSLTITNWLTGYYGWTNTPSNSSTGKILLQHQNIYDCSNGSNGCEAKYGYAVRPVVYLDSSIYVVSGNGSELYPYQLSM